MRSYKTIKTCEVGPIVPIGPIFFPMINGIQRFGFLIEQTDNEEIIKLFIHQF